MFSILSFLFPPVLPGRLKDYEYEGDTVPEQGCAKLILTPLTGIQKHFAEETQRVYFEELCRFESTTDRCVTPRKLPPLKLFSKEYLSQIEDAAEWARQQIAQLIAEGYAWDGPALVKRDSNGEVESTVEF